MTQDAEIRSDRKARIAGLGFYFPGDPVALSSLPLTPDEVKRLPRLGQETTHIASEDATALMVHAARDALRACGRTADDIRMVISAPSLVTSYGLEIPAVAVRAELGMRHAQCLNLAQGCVGVLRGIDLAAQMVASLPDAGDIMVVTSCRASAHTRNMNHGAFFWGDAAAAAIVTARHDSTGLTIAGYAESSNETNWGAMRIDCAPTTSEVHPPGQIYVNFPTPEDQIDYIRGEQRHFANVVEALLRQSHLDLGEIDAVFLPSTGRNRIPILFSEHRELLARVETDFRLAHFGGVDPLLSIRQRLERGPSPDRAWLMLVSPAFAAQWGGLLLRSDN